MTISDLLDKKVRGIFSDDAVLKCELIALDAKDGRVLFDTAKNKREYIEQYKTGEVVSLWADVKMKGIGGGGSYVVPVIMCYVSHDSWKGGEAVMSVGINVRRSELIRALAYDRQQYVQGYRDGKADATRTGRWITVRSANSPRARRMCSECKSIDIHRASPFCPQCGAKMVKKKELQL